VGVAAVFVAKLLWEPMLGSVSTILYVHQVGLRPGARREGGDRRADEESGQVVQQADTGCIPSGINSESRSSGLKRRIDEGSSGRISTRCVAFEPFKDVLDISLRARWWLYRGY
jgi:hypothetical protein